MSTPSADRLEGGWRRRRGRRLSLRWLLAVGLGLVAVIAGGLGALPVLGLMEETGARAARQTAAQLAQGLVAGATSAEEVRARARAWVEAGLVEGVALELGAERGVVGRIDAARAERLRAAGHESALLDGGRRAQAVAAQGAGWVVIERVDEGRERERRAAQALILLYLLLSGAAALGVGYAVLTRSLVRPVRRLREATERVSGGDLVVRVPARGAGEVAELAAHFNRMVDALARERARLEETVAALSRANDELLVTNDTLQRTQDQLVRAERLASVGALAAGVAHEIGNPLASTLAYLELLGEPDCEDDERRDLLERARASMQRIRVIIRELLDYSRAGRSRVERVSPRGAIAQALSLVAPQPRLRGVALLDEARGALPEVLIDEGKLVQLLVNLLLNAADAVDGAGQVRVRAGEDDEGVWVAVEDDGPGIAPEVLPRIFDPFFTTKPPGAGSGLGLAICEQIAEQLGGALRVASSPRAGTRFTLRLPRARGGAPDASAG